MPPDLLRTTAPRTLIAQAVDEVLHRHRHVVKDADGRANNPSFEMHVRFWPTPGGGPDAYEPGVWRHSREQRDPRGRRLRVETVISPRAPTLTFVEYEGPAGPTPIVEELASVLRALIAERS